GTPITGAVWSVTVDGFLASVTVGTDRTVQNGQWVVVDSVSAIATRLAELINANRGSTHGAVAVGAQLTIVRNDGNALVVGTPSITNGGTSGTTAVTGVTSGTWALTLAGPVVAGEVWTLTFDGVQRALTITEGMALPDIAAGLARLVNATNGQTALAQGDSLVVSKLTGPAATAPVLAVTPANRVDTSSATVALARSTLAGNVAPGDVWTVSLQLTGGTPAAPVSRFSFTAEGSTTAGVAAGLAAAINAAAGDSFLATAQGSQLLVVHRGGNAFTLGLDVAPAALSVSRNFELQGTVAAQQRWEITLRVGGVDTVVGFTSAGTSLSAMATGLAQAIDATAGFTARVSGTLLTIATEGPNAGRGFTLTTDAPAGTVVESSVTTSRDLQFHGPVVAGDVWTLQLTVGGVLETLTVPVVSTLAQLQADVLSAIDNLASFRAETVGSLLRVSTDGADAGNGFALTYSVARTLTGATSASAAGSTIGLAQGRPATGETWQITVGALTRTHTVLAGQGLGDVLAALAAQINAATAPGGPFVVVRGTTLVATGSMSFLLPARVNLASPATAVAAGSVLIAGVPKVGDTVTVNLGSSQHTVQVRDTVPLAEVAAALAARVNAMGGAFRATVDGSTLVLVDTQASGAATALTIASTGTVGASASRTTSGATTRFLLAGTARNGETWTVTVGTDSVAYVLESLEALAERVALSINQTSYVLRATVTAAAPVAGEAWTARVTLGSTVFETLTTVQAGDALADVLARLATGLNGIGGTAFSTRAAAGSLLLANATNLLPAVQVLRGTTAQATVLSTEGHFDAVFEGGRVVVLPVSGSVAGATASVAPRNSFGPAAATPNNAQQVTVLPTATPKAGETWSLTLDGATYAYNVRASAPLAEIAAGLAARINAAALGFVASVDGNTLVLRDANATPGLLGTSFSIVATPASSGSATRTADGAVTRFALAGTAALGETWSVTIGSSNFAMTVESPTEIVQALAQQINAAVGASTLAFGDGARLMLVRAGSTAIATPVFTVAPAARIAVDTTTPTAQRLVFSPTGTVIAGQTWYVELTTADTVFSFGYAIQTGNGIDAITRGLAAAINAATTAGFTAVARNTTWPDTFELTIVDAAGRGFTAALAIGLADGTRGGSAQVVAPAPTQTLTLGGSVRAGEGWTITLSGAGGVRSYTHLATTVPDSGLLQTREQIAVVLAAAINDDLAGGYTAIVDGRTVLVTSRSGATFTAAGSVAPVLRPAGAVVVVRGQDAQGKDLVPAIDLRIGHRVAVSFSGVLLAPQVGETWSVSVNIGGTLTTRSVVVGVGENLVLVLQRLAAVLTQGTGFGAQASGTTLEIISGSVAVPSIVASRTSAGASPVTTLLALSAATPSGAPVSGARWTLELQVGSFSARFEQGVSTAQDWALISANFATAI
ncbi:MAG: hypothetical protein JNM97_02810, partial [Rhodoferax sp.]|nr:hypothetical protein [Rhodoferax sp.]